MEPVENIYKSIVIGGGMAGLSACIKLLEKGVKNILLIEATDRLGGRIHTLECDNNANIELGAQWIHGTRGNPIFELAKILHQVDQEAKTDFGDIMYYATQDGVSIDEEFTDKVYEKLEYIFDNLDDQIENELDGDQSLKSLLDDGFHHVIKKLRMENANVDLELVKAIYYARLNDEKFDSGCECLSELSAIGWNEYEDFDGDKLTNLKKGYKKIIEYLASQIPIKLVKLNEIVEKIDWTQTDKDPKGQIEVTTFNVGKKARLTYYADTVLCTVSLGCLKHSHCSLFEPCLPADKVNAIERLGFGCVDKIFLVFDKPVFKNSEDVQGLQILWREDISFELNELTKRKWNLHNNNFYKMLETFNVLPSHPNILYGFVIGESAIFIESLQDECLIDIIHELFTKCFPSLGLARPSKIYRSKWNKSQFTRGSYSFIKLGSSIEDIKALAKPLNNKLFFAGEATHAKYYGTVHAAYASGRSAGLKICDSLEKLGL